MKLAIVVGHNSVSQGAVRKDTGETEFVWNSRLARLIEQFSMQYDLEVKIFFREPGKKYRREIADVYKEVDKWGADASNELHFNSADSASATGTETLSSGSALSLRMAKDVQDEMVSALGLRDRGVKTRASSDRGGASLMSGNAPAIMIEPFFGSSGRGQEATDDDAEQINLAHAILRGTRKAMASFPRSTLTESRTIKAVTAQKTAQVTQAVTGVSGVVIAALDLFGEQLGALPPGNPLEPYLPVISALLFAATMGVTAYQRAKSDQIAAARIDDHQKEIR